MKKNALKYGIFVMMLVAAVGLSAVLYAEEAAVTTDDSEQNEEIQMPDKNTPEYWNLRSEAISQFVPFLTKKRSEAKRTMQAMADYLLQIGKASEFADSQIPVPTDLKVFADILRISQPLQDMNVQIPKERPTWDQLMDIAMKHVMLDGFLPTAIEPDELAEYIEMCKKKEEYGQKVRKDIRTTVDQCGRMWAYLDSIGELGNFKSAAADKLVAQKVQQQQQKAAMLEQKRQDTYATTQSKEQQKEQDAMSRASFQSSKRERAYEDRQARLQHSQTILDSRLVNSGAGVY